MALRADSDGLEGSLMTTMDASHAVKVVLVEDEPLYRDLLRIALSSHPLLEVIGAFADGESALAAVSHLQPRVAVLDIELRGSMNGVQLGMLLRQKLPKLGIVLLSNHEDPQFLTAVPRNQIGGWSYLLKKSVSDVSALGRAIEGAGAGFVVLDPQLATGMRPRPAGRLAQLSSRQREILSLIAQGFTNAAIAQRLNLAGKSVENQINQLYQQLDIDREDPSLQPRVRAVLIYLHESQPGAWGEPPRGKGC